MRICDSCYRRDGSNVAASQQMLIGPEQYDLCASCIEAIKNFISDPIGKVVDFGKDNLKNGKSNATDIPKKRGRPRKRN